MIRLEDLPDIDALSANQIPESSSLEYKASPAIGQSDGKKRELVKDVSARVSTE
jgi:hypothetical protein